MKPGDKVRLNNIARRHGVKTRDPDPWVVDQIKDDGLVRVWRRSKRTGQRYLDWFHIRFLDVVKE